MTTAAQITITDKNREEVEIWLGDAFETHLPSRGLIEYHACSGDRVQARIGETLRRCADGVHDVLRDRILGINQPRQEKS